MDGSTTIWKRPLSKVPLSLPPWAVGGGGGGVGVVSMTGAAHEEWRPPAPPWTVGRSIVSANLAVAVWATPPSLSPRVVTTVPTV